MSKSDATTAGEPKPTIVGRMFSGLRKRMTRTFWEEVVILLSLSALCLAVRWIRATQIEFYEDTITKWHFVRQWFYDNDFSHATWTHHMARYGINVPVYFSQLLFGRSPYVYYVAPAAAGLVQVLFVYLIGRRLAGRAAGVIGAILRVLFTGMDQGSCQLLPDGFGATAIIIVSYLLLRYHDADDRTRIRWLVGVGLALVWSYTIKESNLLFAPGILACVWLSRRRIRDGLLLTAIPIVAIGIETLVFALTTDYASRLAIVEEAHGRATATFIELFERYVQLTQPWQMLLWMWVPSALGLLVTPDRRRRIILIVPVAFLFFLTFLVRGINPIVLWTRFQPRYFDPVGPLFCAAVGLYFAETIAKLWRLYARDSWQRFFDARPRWGVWAVPLACVLASVVPFARAYGTLSNTFEKIRNVRNIVNDAYKRNLPIMEKLPPADTLEEIRVRSLKAVYGVYLKDELIATSPQAPSGTLPDILDAVQHGKRYAFVVRNAAVYDNKQLEKMLDDGCAVQLVEKNKKLTLERTTKLPARCRAPRHRSRD
ncbi:MAG TPA: glycosyltransferase family 39 protein [Polyangiaceae bacterium]